MSEEMTETERRRYAPVTTESFDHYCFRTIVVKYAGPTNFKGSRWIATCDGERIIRPYAYELSSGSANALPVAEELWAKVKRSEGTFVLIPGELDSDRYVFLVVPEHFFR